MCMLWSSEPVERHQNDRGSRALIQGSGGTPDMGDKVVPDWHATSLAGLADQHKQAVAATSKA
jgi:hypothetical protein